MCPERVVIAEIIRPRGNRGELVARSLTDVPGRLQSLRQARVRFPGGADDSVEIQDAWHHKGEWVLKLAGVDSISSAERFRGADLWVPRSERGKLGDGEWFRTDLIGCSLIDQATNQRLGAVEGWQQYGGGPPLMETTVEGREVLVPFVPDICRAIDLESRVIRVTMPDGLLDL